MKCEKCRYWNDGEGSDECIRRGCFDGKIDKINKGDKSKTIFLSDVQMVEDMQASGRKFDREDIRLREGFVCPECNLSVLCYEQPLACVDHEN